jgi:hypothetical protein
MKTKLLLFHFKERLKLSRKSGYRFFNSCLILEIFLNGSNELSAILVYWGYAYYVTSEVTQVFYLDSQ